MDLKLDTIIIKVLTLIKIQVTLQVSRRGQLNTSLMTQLTPTTNLDFQEYKA